jgi:hypothetical protein
VYGLAGPLVARRLGVRSDATLRLDDDGVPVVLDELTAAVETDGPVP